MKIILFILISVSSCSDRYEPFIIGGRPVSPPNKWPWVAAIETASGELKCVGALINPTHVLTSAYCLDKAGEIYNVILGTNDRTKRQGAQVIAASGYLKHERYNEGTSVFRGNDIGIIQLSKPATIDSNTRPILMVEPNTSINPRNCYYAGWGATRGGGPASNVLMDGLTGIATLGRCLRAYRTTRMSRTTQYCTIRAGPCNGDTGSPLMCSLGSTWYLTGIGSWGSCSSNLYPHVSTKIQPFHKWVNDHLGKVPGPGPGNQTQCSNVTSIYSSRGSRRQSVDEVWCNTGTTGTLTLTEGTGGRTYTCTYAWRTDDGLYMMEMQCDGYTTRKSTFTLGSAKAEALCSAKHSLMTRGPNKPIEDTVAMCSGNATASDPYVTVRCTQ